MSKPYPLRPFLVADTPRLQDLYAQSIEELTQDDYDEEQRLAWISRAADGAQFAERLQDGTTLLVEVDGELLGFASLTRDNAHIDMLHVHPYAAGQGVGAALVDALERLAGARGAKRLTVDASDTAREFFERRGYEVVRRNTFPIDDVWVANTTLTKALVAGDTRASETRS